LELVKETPKIDLDKTKELLVKKIDEINDISNADKNIMLTDFSELMSAIIVSNSGYDVKFPKDDSEKLIDLNTVDNIGISVKKDEGGKPSITGVIERLGDKVDKEIKTIFSIIEKEPAKLQPIRLAGILSKKSDKFKKEWTLYKGIIDEILNEKVDWDKIVTNKQLGDLLMKACRILEENMSVEEIREFLFNFGKKMGMVKSLETNKYVEGFVNRWGFLYYPLKVSVIHALNENKEILNKINVLLKDLNIKQLYFRRHKEGLLINNVEYGSTGFLFDPGADSSTTPGNSKIAFRILKKLK
jgi:hypothetical protein